MIDTLLHYGLFLAKTATVAAAAALLIAFTVSVSRRRRAAEGLAVRNLNKKYDAMARTLRREMLTRRAFRRAERAQKARRQAEAKHRRQSRARRRIFVINFRGDLKATAVASLREEVTAVLSVAEPGDEVLVRLENAGGLVHDHGLAAAQLMRIRRRGIRLVAAVDKVAASGGYMMACCAERILAAPFAVIGSIGVLAQMPNFHRLLDRHGIDFELIKAGEYKRTVTLFGKNTQKERAKLKEDVERLHALFKEHVRRNRPGLDIDKVATGEYWHGMRALELKLVDEIMTSDEYLAAAREHADVFEVRYAVKKPLGDRLVAAVQAAAERAMQAGWLRAGAHRPIP